MTKTHAFAVVIAGLGLAAAGLWGIHAIISPDMSPRARLERAVDDRDARALDAALRAGADPTAALPAAVRKRDARAVGVLLDHGAHVGPAWRGRSGRVG